MLAQKNLAADARLPDFTSHSPFLDAADFRMAGYFGFERKGFERSALVGKFSGKVKWSLGRFFTEPVPDDWQVQDLPQLAGVQNDRHHEE